MAEPQTQAISASDGYTLGGLFYRAGQRPRAICLVTPAVGTKQSYYASFARFLSASGFHVLTFDMRGIGASRPADLRGFPARMRDWGELDIAAGINHAHALAPDVPLVIAGHSGGGFLHGLADNNHLIKAAAAIATPYGYWRMMTGNERWKVLLAMKIVLPGVARLRGYVPGWLGIGEDLPAGVVREWARWCTHPDFLFGDETLHSKKHFASLHAPILNAYVTDDPWANAQSSLRIMSHFTNADITTMELTPQMADLTTLGHFGFFRKSASALWPKVSDWLLAQIGP